MNRLIHGIVPLVFLAIASTSVNAQRHSFRVGEPFPLVTLPSLEDGQPMSLAQFRGQKVILHVFASW